ncbi:MAG: hypothetical protein AABX29_00455 [Nanoarchaeota archaeon]
MNRRRFLYTVGTGLASIVLAGTSILLYPNQREDGFYWCDGKVVDTRVLSDDEIITERRLLEYVQDDKIIGHFSIVETHDLEDKISFDSWETPIDGDLVCAKEFGEVLPEILKERIPVLMRLYKDNKNELLAGLKIEEIYDGDSYKGLKFSFVDRTYETFTPPSERQVKTTAKIGRKNLFQILYSKLSSYLPSLDGIGSLAPL